MRGWQGEMKRTAVVAIHGVRVMPKMSSMNACEIEPTSALSLWIFTCLFARSLPALLEESNPDASNNRASYGTPALLIAPSMADVTNCAKMSTADGMATCTPI